MASPNLTLYCNTDPNSSKTRILLRELDLPFTEQIIDITKNEHKEKWFLEYNPNGRIPALKDGEHYVFESGAILLYVAELYDRDRKFSYAPTDTQEYSQELSWLMWQMGGLGPMQGQAHNFVAFAPVRSDYGIERYTQETRRLYTVLNTRLEESRFVAGDKYTIADMAIFPWVRIAPITLGIELVEWPAVRNWHDVILGRKAVREWLGIPEVKASDGLLMQVVAGGRKKMEERENEDIH